MDPDLAALERAVRAEPGDAAAKTRLAHAYAQAGRPAEAYLTWLDLGQDPPAAVTEAAFVAQEDTLRGLAGGWGNVASQRSGLWNPHEPGGFSISTSEWSWIDASELLLRRCPLLAADLTGSLSWGAEDALREVASIATLTWLALPCGYDTPPLEQLTSLPALRFLSLEGEHVDDAALEPLSRLSALRELSLIRAPRVRNAWPQWLGSSVERLNCDLPSFGDDGLERLARVSALRDLGLGCGLDVTDAGLAELARLPRLQNLRLGLGEQVRGAFLKAFVGSNLEGLLLLGGTLDPAELTQLGGLPQLTSINVPTIDNAGLASLAKAPLRSIFIDVGVFDDDGVRALGPCSTLRSLQLGWASGVTGVGFSAWSPGLVELSGSAGFDDDGARALQHLTTLEVVDLEHAERLTDEGLAALATLPALRSLTITGEVTDLGLRALHGRRSLRSLTIKEGITGPNLTEGALDGLVATVPGLEVFRQGFY